MGIIRFHNLRLPSIRKQHGAERRIVLHLFASNVNGDDVIDAEDLLVVDNAVFNYATGTNVANLNGDNIVDIEDMAICDNNARAIRVVERPGSLESESPNEIIIVP